MVGLIKDIITFILLWISNHSISNNEKKDALYMIKKLVIPLQSF